MSKKSAIGQPNWRPNPQASLAYSPAWEALEWQPQMLNNDLGTSNPFKGPPRPEFEEAWDRLLSPDAVRVGKDILEKINKTSVELSDRSGYFRQVRAYLHPDLYQANKKEANRGQHIDHCLESLRQYIMCNADLTLMTYDWIPNFPRPWPNFKSVHQCANWQAIEDWAWAHNFDYFNKSLLQHPNYEPDMPGPFDYSGGGNDI
ncbi:hypothetical protein GQ53DRAFT_826711 [Thozetella sp. PMI_491]|nr:hypothetical protein GQ53DRAFT_826711 [Thozetella sp. PMI_491]